MNPVFLLLAFATAPASVPPSAAAAVEPAACALPGHAVQWIADYCLYREETDDLIAAGACIEREQSRSAGLDECGIKARYKSRLCSMHVERGTRDGSVQDCVSDPGFSGTIVRNDGLREPQAQGTPMTSHARGTFEVSISPQPADVGDPAIGRMSLDKKFHGPLQATSRGQMLALRTGTEGSAGYVAIERVTGSLDGRRGSFALQHSGIMDRGVPALVVSVIPDSGTDELAGLSGTMAINVASGKHEYAFDYSFAEAAP